MEGITVDWNRLFEIGGPLVVAVFIFGLLYLRMLTMHSNFVREMQANYAALVMKTLDVMTADGIKNQSIIDGISHLTETVSRLNELCHIKIGVGVNHDEPKP